MELIDQHTKSIMEGCKRRAHDAGLRFQDETLEYIVTNRDLLELAPKVMIPTLYDYWVHDVEVLREKGKYELYPHNPYETVINTRPAISFYNDNNPDWLNVMIFYHVLAHVDFFQNNLFFKHTWDYDFAGQALSDKRVIAKLRAEKGRWVDYIIEFARGIDNLVGYHSELAQLNRPSDTGFSSRVDYYFDVFLQHEKKVKINFYVQEIERYNKCLAQDNDQGEKTFFSGVDKKYPEFKAVYEKYRAERKVPARDLLQFLLERSPFLNKGENKWMKSIIEVVRTTSLFFQPQIRTKIMNEGWASYWHETLFLQDDRIKGHEVDFARVNAAVTAMPRVGMNPYAMGMRLFYYIEEFSDKGRYSLEFHQLRDAYQRRKFDNGTGGGHDFIFTLRENLNDFLFINTFLDQDFMNRHNLFVVGRRMNQDRMVWEYYVKSRKVEEYRKMLLDSMYHPPHIVIDHAKTQNGGILYLDHLFEEKPLVKDYIANTMLGIEFLWGGPVQLETSEIETIEPVKKNGDGDGTDRTQDELDIKWRRVRYTMKEKKLTRETL
jgi:stage V sporulation protein R